MCPRATLRVHTTNCSLRRPSITLGVLNSDMSALTVSILEGVSKLTPEKVMRIELVMQKSRNMFLKTMNMI
jgi:hypothetical protein